MSDALHVKGPDGVVRTLGEHYDGMSDVEKDPYGAWLAIQNQSTRIEALEAESARLREQYESVISERPYIVGWNAGFDYAQHGDETRDVPDVVSALLKKERAALTNAKSPD